MEQLQLAHTAHGPQHATARRHSSASTSISTSANARCSLLPQWCKIGPPAPLGNWGCLALTAPPRRRAAAPPATPPPRPGVEPQRVYSEGYGYLASAFPELDYFDTCRVVTREDGDEEL